MSRTRVAIPVERQSGQKTTRVDLARQTQSAGAQAAVALNNFPLQPGVLVTGVVCSVGPVIQVIHGLGRLPKGWFAVRRYSYTSGTIGEVEAAASTTTTLSLGALGAYTADIWIF